MSKRAKTPVLKDISETEMQKALSSYLKNLERLADLERKHERDCAELGSAIRASFSVVQAYAVENPQLFEKRKTLEQPAALIGFRTSKPTIAKQRGLKWSVVTDKLRQLLPDFVRTTYEPNKKLLLTQRDNPEVNQHFKAVGISVEQPETFFIEPKE